MTRTDTPQKIAFVGDYLPRQCGIATFTFDLRAAVAAYDSEIETLVVPTNDTEDGYDYPPEVRFEIAEQNIHDYYRAADFLNLSNVDVVSLQHEFGIFGGPAGSHILVLLRNLHMPVVTTLHTVLREPSADQRRVMDEIINLSARLVVMAERGREFLREIYNVPDDKIDLIPHGIPDMPFVDPNFYKDQFGVEGKFVLLSFGLLSPNKGIENVLKALPEIIRHYPNVVYIILGATHPHLLRTQGESYRLHLERLAHQYGLKKHVIFYNRFVDLEELKAFLGAADIYITPYLNEAQITSGTLSYAFGCGKAVISTPYWHARDLLADDHGILVPFNDSDAIADAVVALLQDEKRRHAMRKKAYLFGREMVWSNVAYQYAKAFRRARQMHLKPGSKRFMIRTLEEQRRQLPSIKLDHVLRLTDTTGILQHAVFTLPNFAEGYCTDDNARALLLMVQMGKLGVEPRRVRALTHTYSAFLHYAFNPKNRRFRNFMAFDRRWLEETGSEDSHGRALWALGYCVAECAYRPLQTWAAQTFDQALSVVTEFTAPRAWAFALLGLHAYLQMLSGDRFANQIREQLMHRLIALYRQNAGEGWHWFEEILAYDNARLSHALIANGNAIGDDEALRIGLESLEWLLEVQTSAEGYLQPIGSNGWYSRAGKRAQFDQQPLIPTALTSACLEAYRVTGESGWLEQARTAFEWFLGRNDLGLALYDPDGGGCYDGLHVDRLNQNQGAESTLSFLLALTEMQMMENTLRTFEKSPQESVS